MKRNKPLITVLIAFLILGGAIAYTFFSGGSDYTGLSQANVESIVNKESPDYVYFNDLQSDEYDRAFLANMIAHHEGAVAMAELATESAEHQAIKDMAENIISAQNREITDMKSWQRQWGYPSTSGEMMEDHSAMGMMSHMEQMTGQLNGLSGDAFDKMFLALMIEHHSSAIDMAYPGNTNAKHGEVKTLVKAILRNQSSEIAQMKQWQKDWGYSQ